MAGNFHTSDNEQHIYHHSDRDGARVNVKAERNSKGWNYEATVTDAKSPDEAMQLLLQTIASLEAKFGNKQESSVTP